MKHLTWVIAILATLLLHSCGKDYLNGDTPKTENGQDRDYDEITGDDYVYHLPVIFHVFYKDSKDPTQYIPHSRLKELIDHVNELYQGNVYNKNIDTTESQNIHIVFELALKDENGNALSTPGVEYVKYPDNATEIDCNTFMNDRSGKYKKYIWEPNDYINVMVYNFKPSDKGEVTLGISNLPFKAYGLPAIDGLEKSKNYPLFKKNIDFPYCVSLNALYVDKKYESSKYTTDKNSTQYTHSRLDPNATLAHELGHYLGLHHVFTELGDNEKKNDTNKYKDTDYCDDTPSYDREEYSTWLSAYTKEHKDDYTLKDLVIRWNDNDTQWLADNLMDYDVCYNIRFTPQQAHRIRQVLYYSTLIPGPKKDRSGSRAIAPQSDEIVDLPIVLAKEVSIQPKDSQR